jgi:ADP-heptose:LPS heptosyltransferase
MADRILLTQLRRIGDVMMTTPAVAAVRAAFPAARIEYLTEAPSDQLLRHCPHVDEVIVWPRKPSWLRQLLLLWRLRRRRYDVVVDFFGNPRSALLTWATGAPRRVGFNRRGRKLVYTDPVDVPDHIVYAAAHKAALVERLGAHIGSVHPQLFLGDAERAYARRQLEALGVGAQDLLVALSPVSRQPYKVWPAQRFARLADVLIERYAARVLFIWGPGEEHFVDQVRLEMKHLALPTYPVPPLLELAAMLQRCHLYVGNDNGPRHLAVAVNTPTVTVFGKPQPQNWTPPGDPRHRVADYDPGCKLACTFPHCDHLNCINGVSYEVVETETERLLEELLRDGRPDRRRPAGTPA